MKFDFSNTEQKKLAILVDPDKISASLIDSISKHQHKIGLILVGGSLLHSGSLSDSIVKLKEKTTLPIYIFPGNYLQIDDKADGILLLSLISGRNPDFLIGQHVVAAPTLKQTKLDIIPTGYILIDCGKPTTASYISNTSPIPFNKPEIAACTALAGEQLGLKIIYLDGGSGAEKPVSPQTISTTRNLCDSFIVVGGGIKNSTEIKNAWDSGANLVVVGTAIENNPELLSEL